MPAFTQIKVLDPRTGSEHTRFFREPLHKTCEFGAIFPDNVGYPCAAGDAILLLAPAGPSVSGIR